MSAPEENLVPRTDSKSPAPLRTRERPSRIERTLAGISFAIIIVLSMGGLWLGLSSHWQALSSNATIALPQSHAGAPPPARTAVAGNAEQDIAEIKSRTAALDTRLAALERSAHAAQPAGAAPADIGTRLDSIDQRLGTVEVQSARAVNQDMLSALQERVSRLEAENSGDKLRQAAATLALANLARAAQENATFKPELDALAAVAPNDPALKPLQPLAANGVPTFAMLQTRFPQAAQNALDAEQAGPAPAGFFARIWASLRNLVSVRPVTVARGNTTADHLGRAQADLDRGDLTTAVIETKAISGAAATAMAPWLKDGEARLALERAIAGMNGRIVQALAQQAPQSAPPATPPSSQALPTEVPPKARESASAGPASP